MSLYLRSESIQTWGLGVTSTIETGKETEKMTIVWGDSVGKASYLYDQIRVF